MSQEGGWCLWLSAGSPDELRDWMRPLAQPLERNCYGRRDKKDLERWVLAKWILKSDLNNLWQSYPVVVTQPDRPDFVFRSDGASLGVEVGEITGRATEQAQVYSHVQETGCYELLGPDDHDRQMTGDELGKILDRGGEGWNGADPARAFLALTAKLFFTKIGKFKGYSKNSRTILLLYDDSCLPFSWKNRNDKAILDTFPFLFRDSGAYVAICILSGKEWVIYDG